MSVSNTILGNTVFAFREETTEGTPPADSATGAEVLLREDISWSLGREVLESNYLTNSLSKTAPQLGMYGDIGFMAPIHLRGSGTLGTAPDWATMMKVVMGGQFDGTADTVQAAPTPTTTGWTVTSGANFTVGGLVRVAIGASWEYTRVTAIATNALTVHPPVTAAPSTSAACQPGNAFLLKSDVSDHGSGAGYFYFDGGKKILYGGCKGSLAISLATGQKATCDFTFSALNYAESDAAIGYTAATSTTPNPPVCLGIITDILISCTVGAGATTTSIPLVATPDLQIAEYGGTDPAETTYLVVDVGAGVYETQAMTAFDQSTQTATTAALGGAPSEGNTAYVRIQHCIPQLDIGIDMEIISDDCMRNEYGKRAAFYGGRTVTVAMPDKSFTSIYPIAARDDVESAEIWAVLGSTSGNIIVMNIPKFYRTEIGIEPGDMLMKMPESGFAAQNTTSGDDEFFLTVV